MKRIPYIAISLILFGAVSCSKQSPASDSVIGGEICFTAGPGTSLLTKADSKEDIADFAVYGWNTGETSWSSATSLGTVVFSNIQAVGSSGTYSTVGDKKYWGSGKYHFVAYSPYIETSPASFEGAGSSFKFKFTSYTTTQSTVDLLYSHFSTDKVNADGIVPLQFEHALSRIHFTFQANDASDMTGVSGNGITLIKIVPTSISLGNVFRTGSFSYNGSSASWSGITDKGAISNTGVSGSSVLGGYDVYILPQTLPADASFSFVYNVVYQSSSTEITSGPFNSGNLQFDAHGADWDKTPLQMGKQYNVNVKVNVFTGEIEFDQPVETEWTNDASTVEIK